MASLRTRKQADAEEWMPGGRRTSGEAAAAAATGEAQRARPGSRRSPRLNAEETSLKHKMLIVAAVMALVVLGFVGHRGQQEHVAGGEALIVGEASSEANSNVQAAETRATPMLRPGSQAPETTFDEHEDPHVPETENFLEENGDEEQQQKETETVDEHEEEEEQQPEVGEFSHLQKPVAVPNANAKVKVIKVCVQGPNPRVSSLFVRNGLGLFGSQLEFVMAPMLRDQLSQFVASGAIRAAAVPAAETCDPSWPRLNLAFQKGLTARTLATPGQTTFVVGDEYCKCPSDLCGGTSPKVPMRQYHTTNLSSDYLPLGARFEFEPVSSDEIVVAAARTHVYNFAGALTSTSRKQLNTILENAKNNPASPLSRGFVNVAPAWKKDAMADTYVSPTAYRAALLDSMFTLCPAGTNPEAFRIYEAIESGSIPVLVQDAEYAAHPCKDAFKPILDSGAPVVVMGDWSELEETLTRLLPKVNAMQERLLQWRQKFWTKVARQVDCAILGRHSRDTGHSYDRLASCSDLEDDVPASSATTKAASPTLSQSDVLAMTPLTLPVVGSQHSIPLITGCGRSGTLSLMEYLRSINVQAVHEQVATAHVSVSWLYAAESDVYPFELKNSLVLRKKLKASLPPGKPLFGPVVHLTRHPLKVMSSTRRCFCGKGDRTLARGAKNDKRSWVFAERFLPRMRADLPYESLERSAVYWLEWNKMIEENFPERTHVRLEDVDPGVLVRSLGLTSIDTSSLPRTMPRAKFHTSPDKEKVKLPDVTWTELYNMDPDMTREVFELARHYGYELDTTLKDNLAQGK